MIKKFNRDFFWIAACQCIALIVNIGLINILTTELTVESYGYYSLLITVIIFIRQIIYDPTSYVVVKDIGQLSDNIEQVVKRVRAVKFITDRLSISCILISIVASTVHFFKSGSILGGVFLIASVTYLVSNGAYGLFLAILNITKKRKAYALLQIFDSGIKIFIVTLFFALMSGELLEATVLISFSALVSYAVIRCYVYWFVDAESNCAASTSDMARSIFIDSIPLYVPAAMMALKGVADRWVLAAYMGVEDLAVFNVLFQLGFSPIIMIIGVVQTFVAPVVYQFCKQKNIGDIDKAIKYMYGLVVIICLFALMVCFVVSSFGTAILIHIVSEDYYRHIGMLPFFILAGAIAASVGIIHLGVIGIYETNITGKLMVVAMIFGVAISIASVIGWGFNGAVFGLLASNVFAFIIYSLSLFLKRRELRLR